MSFSGDVKKELSKLNTLSKRQVNLTELTGYLLTTNAVRYKEKYSYSTENQYNINRFSKLLLNLNVDYDIKIQGKVYTVNLKDKYNLDYIEINDEELKKALIRGAFLGAGSISDPEISYHVEILFRFEDYAKYISLILRDNNIISKVTKRKNSYMLYIKDGEDISDFLALIGANKAVLKYEEARVLRDMKNNVNRLVNCETANLSKTINASVKQINDIKYIKEVKKFNILDENLKEIANLRLENPDLSLIELGKVLSTPLGKSGVSHRLKKISIYADELRGEGKK